ncbi:nucleoporin p58/p45-like isoform X1 [Lethenteron reissneri]|uniref:nucleoporin p58/p45-like isoform X1 n=1 Tax=Lethenteron reissneri TaxID=7753 RepID=UPI002AB6CB09|nr:nucleoporin p58/p45-like isoform X1 [Lethenteron reissneri]
MATGTSGFSFGGAASTTGFAFGATGGGGTTTAPAGFNFGGPATTGAATTSVAPTASLFGTTGTLGLGRPAGSATLFAMPMTSNSSMGGLSQGTFTATTSAPTTGLLGASGGLSLNLGGTTATTTAAAGGLRLGGNMFSSAVGGSLFAGTSTANTGTGLNLGGTAAGQGMLGLGGGGATMVLGGTGLGLGGTATGLGGTATGLGGVGTALGGTATGLGGIGTGLGGAGSGLVGVTGTGLGGIGSGLGGIGAGLGGMGTALGGMAAAGTNVPVSKGLGGVDFTSSSDKKDDRLSAGGGPGDSKTLKSQVLPPEICKDVENFQKFVKDQRQVQEEIGRSSSKVMLRVQEETKALRQMLSLVAAGLQRSTLAVDKLRAEAAQELKNVEIAVRTRETPDGLQHENTAPTEYFRRLAEQFEVQMQLYRRQIEEMENHITSQATSAHMTPQDLSLAMQRLYETFIALAAHLQTVHETVKRQKEQYLSFRKTYHGDDTDVFEAHRMASKRVRDGPGPGLTTGPAPFGSLPNAAAVAMAATLTQQQQQQQQHQHLGTAAAAAAAGFYRSQGSLGLGIAPSLGTGLSGGLASSLGGSTFGGGSGFASGSSFNSGFSFGAANKPSGSLSAGFAGTAGGSSTSGFSFSNPGLNPSAGLTFGVSSTPGLGLANVSQPLQLKKPPPGNKRGKK